MNELFKTLAAHVEREAKTVASHFRSYAIDMTADAALAKLLTAASVALQAVHEHLERRREDGRPSEAVKIKARPAHPAHSAYGDAYGVIGKPDVETPKTYKFGEALPDPLPIALGRPPNKNDCFAVGAAHYMQLAKGRSWRQCSTCHALECPKCGNVQNLHFLGSECTGCDVCNNLPSLMESSISSAGNWLVPPGWCFARRGNGALWSCCHGPLSQWHNIKEQSLVYVPSNDEPGHLYCREHAPLHSAPPVSQRRYAPSTPSLGAGTGWTTAALEWPCVGHNHDIAIGDDVYFSPLGGGTTYCREHAPLHGALPVGQPLSDDRIERLSFVVSGRVTSDQPFELTLAPDVGIAVHALLHNAEPGTVQFESVQVEGKEPAPYSELLREFRAGYVMHCPKGKNVTVRGRLMGVGMSHRLTVQFFGRKLRFV
jgi:hypothetical protein